MDSKARGRVLLEIISDSWPSLWWLTVEDPMLLHVISPRIRWVSTTLWYGYWSGSGDGHEGPLVFWNYSLFYQHLNWCRPAPLGQGGQSLLIDPAWPINRRVYTLQSSPACSGYRRVSARRTSMGPPSRRLDCLRRPRTTENPFDGGKIGYNFEHLSKDMGLPQAAQWRDASTRRWEPGAGTTSTA